MVRLNRTELSHKQLDVLFTQLSRSLGKLSEKQTDSFLSCLLGKEEKVMFAKRLATIVLLTHNAKYTHVVSSLKMSHSTVSSISKKLDQGLYDDLLIAIKKDRKQYVSLLDILDNVLSLGGTLPTYNNPRKIKKSDN